MTQAADHESLASLIAPARSALLLVDVQEDFVAPTGAARNWGVDLSRFGRPLANVEALLASARRKGVTVAFARVVTRTETDSAALKLLHARSGRPKGSLELCRAGTRGADFYRVRPLAGEIEVEKRLYSSFAGTDLEAQLHTRKIDTLVVAGFTTECCIDSTVRDAFHRDFHVVVATDACQSYDDAAHLGSLDALAKNFAHLTDTQSIVAAWR
jgi:biuret amidohydrolase